MVLEEKILKELLKKIPFCYHGIQSLDGIKFCEQFQKTTSQGTFLKSLVQMDQVILQEKMFKEIVDDARQTSFDPQSSSWAHCAQVSQKLGHPDKDFQRHGSRN